MSCEETRRGIPLYDYGELEAAEEERLEEHVAGCAACGAELARFRALYAAADEAREEAPAALLADCRRDLRLALPAAPVRRGAWQSFRESLAQLAGPFGAWRQPAGALALVALGFFAARFAGNSPGSVAQIASPDAARSSIRSVQQDASGRVHIAFDETRRHSMTGSLEDSRVQQLLTAALRQDADPGVRVETMSVLKSGVVPSGIRDVLVYALQNDPNPGVRLKAVESLRSFAQDEAVRRALAQVLIRDDNPGVRVQAIDLLVQRKDESMVGVLQELVGREDNQYIRMKMAKALEEMNASVGTF